MKKFFSLFFLLGFLVSCSEEKKIASGSGLIQPLPTGLVAAVTPSITGNNVLPVEVDSRGYLNEPVVSVVVCNPGSGGSYPSSSCVTINRVLLDTGSSGLRIFRSLLTSLNLDPVLKGANEVARCIEYGDGTTQWGPVKNADLVLGGETISNVNIHIIDPSYATKPSKCVNAEGDPVEAQYNGILGVGVRDRDCGTTCEVSSYGGLYYSCTGSSGTCVGATTAIELQIQNPVAAITAASNSDAIADDNGSVLVMPSIPSTGAAGASGYLIFGIGTRSNNTPNSDVKVFMTDSNGHFKTRYAGVDLDSFIDSGSNGLFFPETAQNPTCHGWFCPTTTLKLTATQKAYTYGPGSSDLVTNSVSLEIINAEKVFVSQNFALSNLGAAMDDTFDWGLPFFFGRSVYTGIKGKTSTINGTSYNGSYPFYAY